MISKWNSEKENLQKLILEDNISYEEIGRRYGCSGTNIKKVAKKLNIQLPSRKNLQKQNTSNKKEYRCLHCNNLLSTNRKYCSGICQSNYEGDIYIKRWKQELESGHDVRYKISPYIRRYLLSKYNQSCQNCGCDLRNPYTSLSILQIHHIDGDASNTQESNLKLLCPNCHAMTENFGSRNESSIREYRKQEYLNFEHSLKQLPQLN